MDSGHLMEVAEAVRELDVPVLVRLSETQAEVEQIRRELGMSPVEYLDSIGLLDDRRVMPARDVVEMATIGGARALDLQDRIGSLEVGKLADLIIVDTDSVNMTPMYDVYSGLAYAAHPRDVRTVVVNGRVVVRDRRVLNVDVERAKRGVRELTEQIARKASEL